MKSEIEPLSILSIQFTKEEMLDEAKQFLIKNYGPPNRSDDEDKWMERFGLMVNFIDEMFSDPTTCSQEPTAKTTTNDDE